MFCREAPADAHSDSADVSASQYAWLDDEQAEIDSIAATRISVPVRAVVARTTPPYAVRVGASCEWHKWVP
ncbi:hypothetical protein GCM10027053_37300 [Intrasporangium mesophilum]